MADNLNKKRHGANGDDKDEKRRYEQEPLPEDQE